MRDWLTLRLSLLKKLFLPVSSVGTVEIEGLVSMFESLVLPRRALLPTWLSMGRMSENDGTLAFEWEGGRAWAKTSELRLRSGSDETADLRVQEWNHRIVH